MKKRILAVSLIALIACSFAYNFHVSGIGPEPMGGLIQTDGVGPEPMG